MEQKAIPSDHAASARSAALGRVLAEGGQRVSDEFIAFSKNGKH